MSERHVGERRSGVCRLKERAILWNRTEPLHQGGPDSREIVIGKRRKLVAATRAHFRAIRDGEQRERRHWSKLQHLRHLGRQLRTGRSAQPALVVQLDATVPEQSSHRAKVEQRRRVPWNEDTLRVLPHRSEAIAALANRQAFPVAQAERRHVTRHARDVAVAAQDLVERQASSEQDERFADAGGCWDRSDAVDGGELPDLLDHRIDGSILGQRTPSCAWWFGGARVVARAQYQTGYQDARVQASAEHAASIDFYDGDNDA